VKTELEMTLEIEKDVVQIPKKKVKKPRAPVLVTFRN